MPELPEVETTRRGIEPYLTGGTLLGAVVRDGRLRWPVPTDLDARLSGQRINQVDRRAKYLLIALPGDTLIIHLGMSGSLRIVNRDTPADKHDHVDLVMDNGRSLRLHDPRRFGSIHLTADPASHELIRHLGPEPLDSAFNGAYLHGSARHRRVSIKAFIMNARVVVGVGNIYASEALFRSGINPFRAAGRISRPRLERLADAIKEVLSEAIEQGGTTLRDFVDSDGKPGYFKQSLAVYGREGGNCLICGEPVRMRRQGQRATYYCKNCQAR